MGQTESNLGIIPGYGGTQRMARLIGRGLALEHLILGTQIPAAECHRIGLVNRLAKEGETLDDAKALARELGKRPPIATRLIIEAVDDGARGAHRQGHRGRDPRLRESHPHRGRGRGAAGLLPEARRPSSRKVVRAAAEGEASEDEMGASGAS